MKFHFRYLNFIFWETEIIQAQNYKDIFNAVSSTSIGLDILIDFLDKNLESILKTVINGEEVAVLIYSICASRVALDHEIYRVMKKKKKKP